jgi:hypothetical protein
MTARPLITGLVIAVALAGAASAQQGESPGSFAWNGAALPDQGTSALAKVVDARLASAGYRKAEGGTPDVWVVMRVAQGNPEDSGPGCCTLIVDLIHAASNVLIWRSFDSDLSGSSLLGSRFQGLATYAWKSMPDQPGVEAPSTATDRTVRRTIDAAMLFRDWTVARDQAHAYALVTYRVMVRSADVNAPMKATLTVEIVDHATGELAWRGEKSGINPKPKDLEQVVIDTVIALAKEVPPRNQATPR